ncbi:uncharacterized protein [Physcomitrium patens]
MDCAQLRQRVIQLHNHSCLDEERATSLRFTERSNSASKESDEMVMGENACNYGIYNTKEVLEEALFRDMPETLSLVAPNWHRGDCVAKLQKIEKELEQFSEDFGSQLRSLRMSMRNSILSTSEFETWGESCPKNATSKDKHFKLG